MTEESPAPSPECRPPPRTAAARRGGDHGWPWAMASRHGHGRQWTAAKWRADMKVEAADTGEVTC